MRLLELKRKHVAKLEALAKALRKGLPAGAAPTLEQLAAFRFKYSTAADASKREKLNPSATEELERAAQVAASIYAWPRKEK